MHELEPLRRVAMSQYVTELAEPRTVRRVRCSDGRVCSGHQRAVGVAGLILVIGVLASAAGGALAVRPDAGDTPVQRSETTAVDPGIDRRPEVRSSVIVQATDDGLADALEAVRAAGG